MRLFSLPRIFSGTSSRAPAPAAAPKQRPLAAPLASRQEVKLWNAQLSAAKRLMQELDEALPPSHLTGADAAAGSRHGITQLQLAPGMGSQTGVSLNAHSLSERSIVMDRPESSASAAFAALCLQKDVRAVIDLSASNAPGRHCMKSNAPWAKGDTRVDFRCPTQNGFAVEQRLTVGGHGAMHRQVGVYMEVDGKCLPMLHERSRVNWNDGEAPAATVLDWIRLPVDSQRALPPSLLLAISEKAEALGGDAGHCVFQSADGGRTAAMAAVAHDLYRLLKNPQRPGFRLMDAVTESCMRGRARFSHDLFTAPEDIASLIGMARLMEQSGKA